MRRKYDWTRAATLKLIEQYRIHPVLWNSSNPDFGNTKRKYETLKIIGNLLNIEPDEVNRKIRNVISQYKREVRNYKKWQQCPGRRHFQWYGFAPLHFFLQNNLDALENNDDVILVENEEQILGNHCPEEDDPMLSNETRFKNDDSSNSSIEIIEDQKPETLEERVVLNTTNLYNDPASQSNDSNSIPATIFGSNSQENRLIINPIDILPNSSSDDQSFKDQLKLSSLLDQNTKVASKSVKSVNNTREERDEFDLYGELLAQKIRNLQTPYAKSTVQYLFNKILYEAELGKYNRSSDSTTYH